MLTLGRLVFTFTAKKTDQRVNAQIICYGLTCQAKSGVFFDPGMHFVVIAAHRETECVWFDERKDNASVARNAELEEYLRQSAHAQPGMTMWLAEILPEFGQAACNFIEFGVAAAFGPTLPACAVLNREDPWRFRPSV